MKRTSIFKTFEYLNIDFIYNNEKIKFIVVYRPPSSSLPKFREEFQEVMNTLVGEQRKVYICGDFNHWVDDPTDNAAVQFLDLMDCMNFTNDVNVPTARSGHTLDLVFSDKDLCNTRNLQVDAVGDLLHKLITFELNLMINKKIKKTITFRNKANLQPDLLISVASGTLDSRRLESCACNQGRDKADCCNCLADIYNQTLKSSYESMCPMRNKEIIIRDRAPWYNTAINEARKRRRGFEKDWRRRRTTVAKERYIQSKNEVNRLIKERKEEYYRTQTRERMGDTKKLYALFDDLMGKSVDKVLPDFTPELAQNFADFFEEKIDNIYNSLDNYSIRADSILPDFPFCNFSRFEPISLASYKNLVMSTKKSYCENDPLPFGDLMCAPNFDDLLKMQLDIINSSFIEGVFPISEKRH